MRTSVRECSLSHPSSYALAPGQTVALAYNTWHSPPRGIITAPFEWLCSLANLFSCLLPILHTGHAPWAYCIIMTSDDYPIHKHLDTANIARCLKNNDTSLYQAKQLWPPLLTYANYIWGSDNALMNSLTRQPQTPVDLHSMHSPQTPNVETSCMGTR